MEPEVGMVRHSTPSTWRNHERTPTRHRRRRRPHSPDPRRSRSSWKLKPKHDNGRIEVEAEVDTNRVGQVWSWTLSDNGTTFASGTATTAAPSGSFSIRRTTANRPNADQISLTAKHDAVTCGGIVTLP